MERITIPDVRIDQNTIRRAIIDAEKVKECSMEIYWRLKEIEDIIADEESEEYSLDRLRELIEADRDGRCVVLQVKPGEKVRPKQSPHRKPEIVDCVTIYTGGRITYGFHEVGMRNTWVDRWEEEEAEAYIPNEAAEAALQRGAD